MLFCPPKALYPGWANSKVGEQSQKNWHCRTDSFFTHPLQKTWWRPWSIIRSQRSQHHAVHVIWVLLLLYCLAGYFEFIDIISKTSHALPSLLLFYYFLIFETTSPLQKVVTFTEGGGGKKITRFAQSQFRTNLKRNNFALVPVSLLLSYNNYYHSILQTISSKITQFWRRAVQMLPM